MILHQVCAARRLRAELAALNRERRLLETEAAWLAEHQGISLASPPSMSGSTPTSSSSTPTYVVKRPARIFSTLPGNSLVDTQKRADVLF